MREGWSLAGLLAWLLCVEGARYRLAGLTCPSKNLESPVIITDDTGVISGFCDDLAVEIEDNGDLDANDLATQFCLEASDSPLPGGGRKLASYCVDITTTRVEEINSYIKTMSTCPACKTRCGTFYLLASLQDAEGQALWFDSITLRKECTDKPSLSLTVTTSSSSVGGSLRQGTRNPFSNIFVQKVAIKNEVKNCTATVQETTGGCGEQTELASRWKSDTPEVVAFFIPLNIWEVLGEGNKLITFAHKTYSPDAVLNSVGFSNFTSESWFLEEPEALQKLINLGLADMNMFENSIFLHNSSILAMADQEDASYGIGQEVGKVDLAKTALPRGVGYQGLLVIALDPLAKLYDMDRTDNVFVQYVTINGTDEAGEWVDDTVCRAEGRGLGEC